MSTQTQTYAPGTFCWVDLNTTDLKAAEKFYTALFGWTVRHVGDEAHPYAMFLKHDKEVCGLAQMGPQQKGCPPHWLNYVAVADADAALKKAEGLGAKAMLPVIDAMGAGRMAILADPTGAGFALWQPKAHLGAQLTNAPGAVCWNELMTPNVKQATDFYGPLFGWTNETSDMGGGLHYTVVKLHDTRAGGMMPWDKSPAHWLPYFAVENCDGIVARVQELGGKIMGPAMDIPHVGRFAVAQDPQGAHFAFLQPAAR